MKKYFSLLLLMVAIVAPSISKAQSAITMSLAAGDTITNTGTATKTLPRITGGYNGAAIQVTLTKLSGTGAGTVALQGSNTGATGTYVAIGSAFTITNVASQTTMFYATSPLPQYLRILSTGSGTESVVQTITYRLPVFQSR